LGICAISCNKEEIVVDDPIIVVDPPSEIDYPVVTGRTLDEDGSLSEVNISVLQAGELKGTTMSDQNGDFNTALIETDPDLDLLLILEKENYSTSYRKRSSTEIKDQQLAVQLIELDEIYGGSSQIDYDSSEDFISLSGFIKDLDDNPSRAYIAVEYEMGSTFYSASTRTDDLGYYELLLPKETELKVSIFSDTICFQYLTAQEVTIFLGLQAEVMGGFTDDVELDDYINPYTTALSFSISGDILQCDGTEVAASSFTVEINDNQDNHYFEITDNNTGGAFSFSEDRCLHIPYTVNITGRDLGNNTITDTSYLVETLVFNLEDIELRACTPIDAGLSSATLVIDGTTYNFNQIKTRLENSNLVADELTDSYATFVIPDAAQGQKVIYNLEMADWFSGTYFKAADNPMNINVTEFGIDHATVICSGEFLNFSGQMFNGVCTLNLKF